MTTATMTGQGVTWRDDTLQVAGGEARVFRAGNGPPLVLLGGDTGHPPSRAFAAKLAESNSVLYPCHPGFSGTPNPAEWEWMMNVRDLAIVHRQLLELAGLDRVALVGVGFGGWVAAEMATMSTRDLRALVLVNPMGIQPKNAYIYDQFLVSSEAYVRQGYADEERFDAEYGHEPEFEQLDDWETDRSMASRLAWKPYMFNQSLPGLLRGVNIPARIIISDANRIVPPECGELYRAALPNATLESMPGCGHAVDVEHPEALAANVTSFLTGV